jgi:hypothetical protein
MEIIDTELTTREIADRLAVKQGKAWTYTSTHGKSCEKCVEATQIARSYATVRGSVSATYRATHPTEGDHSGTATRVR